MRLNRLCGCLCLTVLTGFGLAPVVFAAPPGGELQKAIVAARDRVLPALVNVQPVSEVFAGGRKTKGTSIGSGVVIDGEGHVITNYHVAGNAEKVLCTLSNQERVSGKLVGGDPLTDVAVVKLDPKELRDKGFVKPAVLGNSDELQMGDFVLALGSPMALSRSMTWGIVSNPRRYLSDSFRLPTGERTGSFNTWIQTDAPINPGNSGGPLVNLKGEIVGINARIVGFADGLGFAIPINVVKDVTARLVSTGKIARSWIGVEFQPLEDVARAQRKGVVISSVAEDSPARRAGIREGDLLLEYDGQPVSARFDEEVPSVARLVADTPVGKTVKVSVLRNDIALTLSLTTQELGKLLGGDMECKEWGLTVRGITDQMMRDHQLADKLGVLVTGVQQGTDAAQTGLQAGDVIRVLDNREAPDLRTFESIYGELVTAKKPKVLLKVFRREAVKYFVIKSAYDTQTKR